MGHPGSFQETLRRLAMIDETFVEDAAGTCLDPAGASALDSRTAALLRLGALVATGASPACLQWSTGRALAAGVADDEIADVLLAIAPVAGLGRVFSAAPEVATALGYDITAALEELDDPGPGDGESAHPQVHDGQESFNRIINSLFRAGLCLHAAAGLPGDAARGSISEAVRCLDHAIREIACHTLSAP